MRKKNKYMSTRKVILLTFIISLFAAIVASGIVIFANWISLSKKTINQVTTDTSENLYNQVYDFMQVPYKIAGINHRIIENGMLDLSNEHQRDRFFTNVFVSQSKGIYSFGYATVAGEYYATRKNGQGAIELIICDALTGWHIKYYSTNVDGTRKEFISDGGNYDPRTQLWYTAVLEEGKPIYSPVYNHFAIEGLTVSVGWPVYNHEDKLEGVISVHLLLGGFNKYLKSAVEAHQGTALIIEKDSHELIANSLDTANFAILSDNSLQRYEANDIDNEDVQKIYQQYLTNDSRQQVFKGDSDNFFLSTKEINLQGIDWIIIVAIPESVFMKNVYSSMLLSGIIAVLLLILLVIGYNFFMTNRLKPIKTLLKSAESFSQGNFKERINIVRNDEIGLISQELNKIADKLEVFVSELDETVKQRTEELQRANSTLEESKEALQLILDFAAEGIYGVDLNGNCTFCNLSCLKLLGYKNQKELLGKNIHQLIHHSYRNGTKMPKTKCKIVETFTTMKGTHVDDEVFWRADGVPIEVEYYSYPQIKNDELIGVVVTFNDISKRRQKEAAIEYLNCYDPLTNFQNRTCFEKNRKTMDSEENLPLSIIFADINGLKMTNDIFGHAAGDQLIKESAAILKQSCREHDLIARIGGDEFIILLPKTTRENANKIMERVKEEFKTAHVEAIKCSISLGCATKETIEQSFDEVMANAENAMYKEKALSRKATNKNIIDTIIETLHQRNPKEKRHSIDVSNLCVKVGSAMKLSEVEISKLKRAAYLHDIGKIVLDEKILKKDYFTEEEREKIRLHSAVGYRILNLFDDTLDLAEYVYGHHERWDGSGYPRGLKGEQIPLISRIITAVETYDRVLNRGELTLEERKKEARNVIKEGGGTQFDPQVAEILVSIIDQEITSDQADNKKID